jgi:NAD(P)-dependent dehydrogenase (short-subunit alcohol dehydrogenase family)
MFSLSGRGAVVSGGNEPIGSGIAAALGAAGEIGTVRPGGQPTTSNGNRGEIDATR